MTENDTNLRKKAKKIYDATESIILKAGEKTLDGAKEFLNHPIDTMDKIYEGLKDTSKKALNFGVDTATNLLTDPQKALHTGLGLMERGLNAIPLVGGFFSFLTGTAKDALTDKKFEEMANQIQGVKEGLNSLADAVGDALDGLRGEMAEALEAMGARQDQLEQFTKAFQAEQNKVNQQVQKKIENIEETLKEHEKKIKDNAEKIFKEQIKLEDVRSEIKDQIRVTNTNIENLRQEQEETKHDFEKYKHQINEKSAKTEQAFDDLQADYTKRNKIIETQIHDNEEQLSEFQENLSNVEFQQKKLSLEHQEMADTLEEQVNLAREQKIRLDFVVNEIDDIQEEFNQKINRITQSQLEQEEKVDEAVFAAKRATRKVDEIADKLEKHSKKVDNLAKQIEKNKQDTQKAKEEAKRANERIDSLLKNQQLLDHSKETQALDKIKKSLELKAEEAQLLASLELLKKTQKLITTPAEREWKVGTKQGTEKDIPREEGYLLNPNSSWAKQYTPEQLREWGWDTRLLNDNENAPLTDPEKRKLEQTQQSSQPEQPSEQSSEQQKNLQEVIEETKSQLLEQLQDLQEQINENVSFLEEKTIAPQEDSESEEEEIIEELAKKETQLRTERAQAKVQLTKSRNKQQSLQQQKAQTKSEIIKEQKQIQKIEQSLGNPSLTPQQKKKLQENKIQKEDKLTQLQQQLEKIEAEEKKQEKATEQAEEAVEKKNKEIEKVQQQKPHSITSKKIDKDIRDAEQKANQAQHEYVEQQWQEVKKQEEQILEDSPETPTLKKVEEKIQEIKESQSSTAAPQKSMSLYMFYLIIFLLEYIVYKRNGLPGLVVLNIILLICYWYKDQLTEHYKENYKSFGKYLLIIGYIIGNVLAYSAPEQEKYKWPCVIGFNTILAALYSYTWYQKGKEVETKQQELIQAQEEFAEETIQKETEYIDRLQESQEILEKVKERTKNSSTVNFSTLSQGVGGQWFTSEEDIEKARKIYEEIKQKWSKKESEEHLTSPEAQKLLKLVQESGTVLSEEERELIQKIQTKQKEIDYREFIQLTSKIPPVQEDLKKTLTKLLANLSAEQTTAISSQSPYLRDNQDQLTNIYSHLSKEEKLKLLNSGLDSLQINTKEQKQELLNIRLTTQQEERNFDLSVAEKENILRLITSRVSEGQLKTYEEYGVPLYNASSWQITPEHKKSLLGLVEDLIRVEDKEKLFNIGRENLEKFPLSGKQEQILKTLAPLQREYNYSENLLKKLNSLPNRQFLTQREIIPLVHRKTTDPYQELKKKVLAKQYKEVSWEIKKKEKATVAQQTQNIRNSLLPTLLLFAQMNSENLAYQEYRLSKETFQEKEDWVSIGAIDSQHRNLLFLSGFKQVPRYYFFDLLIFTCENFIPIETSEEELTNFDKLLVEYTLEIEWEKYLELVKERENKELQRKVEWLNSLTSSEKSTGISSAPQLTYLEEKFERLASAYDRMRDYLDNAGMPERTTAELTQPPTQSASTPYDELLSDLDQEERERLRKKKARDEAKKKLDEMNFANRQANLSEKDRKLKEEEEKRQRDKELAEQEAEKARLAQEARNKALTEDRRDYLSNEEKRIAEAKKRAEEELAFKEEQNRKEKEKKEQEIEELRKKNEQEENRIEEERKLMERQLAKELEEINIADKEGRQRIEDKFKKRQNEIKKENDEIKRKNDDEIKEKEAALIKEKLANQAELDKIRNEIRVQEEQGRQAREAAQAQERLLKEKRERENDLQKLRSRLYDEVLEYYFAHDEGQAGTKNPRKGSGGLREMLDESPSMEFNLHFGDIVDVNRTNRRYRRAIAIFRKVVGNKFVTKGELKNLLEEKVTSLDYMN